MSKSKLEIVKDSITQVGVPAMLNEVLEGCEVRPTPYTLQVTESGEYTVKAEDVDAEERAEAGLTPWDGLAQVNVTVDVPTGEGAGWITEMEDKEYDSIEAAEELNMMDVKGALFSYNASTGKYHVWNAAAIKAWDYTVDCSENYDEGVSPALPSWTAEVEFPTNEYGDVIAVCAGKGLWVSTKWTSATGRAWCSDDSPMYSFQWDCFDLSGAEVARKLYDGEHDLTGSIFAEIKDFEGITDDGTKGHWFLPSRSEIFQVVCACADAVEGATDSPFYTYKNAYYNATHIIALSNVWSCSQNVNDSNFAYYLDNANYLMDNTKGTECCSAVCLRFGGALAPAETLDTE